VGFVRQFADSYYQFQMDGGDNHAVQAGADNINNHAIQAGADGNNDHVVQAGADNINDHAVQAGADGNNDHVVQAGGDDNNDSDIEDGEYQPANVAPIWDCVACGAATKNCIVLLFKVKYKNGLIEFLLVAFQLSPNFCILWARRFAAFFWDMMVQNEKIYILGDHVDVVVFSALTGDYIEEWDNHFFGPGRVTFNFYSSKYYRFQRLVTDTRLIYRIQFRPKTYQINSHPQVWD
jgi:hypothetical protein